MCPIVIHLLTVYFEQQTKGVHWVHERHHTHAHVCQVDTEQTARARGTTAPRKCVDVVINIKDAQNKR